MKTDKRNKSMRSIDRQLSQHSGLPESNLGRYQFNKGAENKMPPGLGRLESQGLGTSSRYNESQLATNQVKFTKEPDERPVS